MKFQVEKLKKALLLFAAFVVSVFLSAELYAFIHPGLINNQAELDLMKTKVAAGAQPWLSGYQQIPDYRSHTPIARSSFCWAGGTTQPDDHIWADSRAAYGCALRWWITGDESYAQKAVSIFNNWKSKTFYYCNTLHSTDLAIEGGFPQMIWAAEIIRASYSGWSQSDQDQFKQFLIAQVYTHTTLVNRTLADCSYGAQTIRGNNWAIMGAETKMAIGIYAERQDFFNEAVLDYKFLNNASFISSGKYLETCRCPITDGCSSTPGCDNSQCTSCNSIGGGDIGHTQLALQGMTAMAEMAKKQGVDLYSHVDPVHGNSLLTTLKFHAPFIGFPGRGSDATWPCSVPLANVSQGTGNNYWEMAYNHYRDSALQSVALWNRPEDNVGWGDVGWGTLTHTYFGQVSADTTAPSAPAGINIR